MVQMPCVQEMTASGLRIILRVRGRWNLRPKFAAAGSGFGASRGDALTPLLPLDSVEVGRFSGTFLL
jgi:hypothetical protein